MTGFEMVLVQFFGITIVVGICLGIAISSYKHFFPKEDTVE